MNVQRSCVVFQGVVGKHILYSEPMIVAAAVNPIFG